MGQNSGSRSKFNVFGSTKLVCTTLDGLNLTLDPNPTCTILETLESRSHLRLGYFTIAAVCWEGQEGVPDQGCRGSVLPGPPPTRQLPQPRQGREVDIYIYIDLTNSNFCQFQSISHMAKISDPDPWIRIRNIKVGSGSVWRDAKTCNGKKISLIL